MQLKQNLLVLKVLEKGKKLRLSNSNNLQTLSFLLVIKLMSAEFISKFFLKIFINILRAKDYF